MKMKIDKSLIIEACLTSNTMTEAHRKLGKLKYTTFAKYAKFLGCYKPNQGSKGSVSKSYKDHTYYTRSENPLSITSHKLKLKLIRDGVKQVRCEICKIVEWNGLPVPLELDHIDGNHFNNYFDNLRIICPNCHAQTLTNSGRKNKLGN